MFSAVHGLVKVSWATPMTTEFDMLVLGRTARKRGQTFALSP